MLTVLRNITGEYYPLTRNSNVISVISEISHTELGSGWTSGAFKKGTACIKSRTTDYSNWEGYTLAFDSSRVVPTSTENRPVNIAFLPLITY